jgi:hypothetical protein
MPLKATRHLLMAALAIAIVSVLIGVVATLLTRRADGGPTILAPLLLLPSLALSLRYVRRVEQGKQVEDPTMARLRGWLVPLFAALVATALLALDVAWLMERF